MWVLCSWVFCYAQGRQVGETSPMRTQGSGWASVVRIVGMDVRKSVPLASLPHTSMFLLFQSLLTVRVSFHLCMATPCTTTASPSTAIMTGAHSTRNSKADGGTARGKVSVAMMGCLGCQGSKVRLIGADCVILMLGKPESE